MENLDQIVAERFKEIPQELRDYMVSEEFTRKTGLVTRKYRLSASQQSQFENEVALVLLVLESEDNLHIHFEEMGLAPEVAANLALDVSEYLLKKVDNLIAHTQDELVISEEGKVSVPVQVAPAVPPKQEESLTKESILAHIENPPRTVIKRYVLEHEPITDPEHLIDDKVDDILKLE